MLQLCKYRHKSKLLQKCPDHIISDGYGISLQISESKNIKTEIKKIKTQNTKHGEKL